MPVRRGWRSVRRRISRVAGAWRAGPAVSFSSRAGERDSGRYIGTADYAADDNCCPFPCAGTGRDIAGAYACSAVLKQRSCLPYRCYRGR
jgi:hypothetical protein